MTDASIEASLKKIPCTEDEILGYLIRKRIEHSPTYGTIWLKGDVLHKMSMQNGKLVSWKAEKVEVSFK